MLIILEIFSSLDCPNFPCRGWILNLVLSGCHIDHDIETAGSIRADELYIPPWFFPAQLPFVIIEVAILQQSACTTILIQHKTFIARKEDGEGQIVRRKREDTAYIDRDQSSFVRASPHETR